MEKSLAITSRKAATVAFAITLGVLAGCGNAHTFSLDPGQLEADARVVPLAGIEGADVELRRYATGCDAKTPDPIVAKVGDGTEFSAEQVGSLSAPCPESPSPDVDIQIEHRTLVFDFSNVEQSAGFPASEFDGYILDIAADNDGLVLVQALIDRDATTLDLEEEALSYDESHLEVNFAGATYDSSGFVKIDLFFADLSRD